MSNSLFKRVVTLLLVVLMSSSGMSFKAVRADSSSTWEKVDDIAAAAASGKSVAITMTTDVGKTYALPTAEVSKNPAANIATKDGDTLEIGGLEPGYGWTITLVDDGYTITNSAGSYLYLTNANSGVVIGESPSSGYVWSITSGYLAATPSEGGTRYMGVYTPNGSNYAQDWRCYKSIVGTNIDIQTLEFWTFESSTGEPDPEPELTTIAEALNGDENATYKVKGVVTLVDGANIYIQDETGGICLYFSTVPTDIALGDTVIGTGKRVTYRGLPELSGATYEKSEGLTLIAKETSISDLTTTDVCTYVELKDLEITEVFDNNGAYTSPNIKVKDSEGKTIQIYRAVVDKVDGAWALSVGDKIDVKAAVGINNTTLQLRNTKASEITVISVTPVVVATPVADVAEGEVEAGTVVTFSTATADAVIKYSIDDGVTWIEGNTYTITEAVTILVKAVLDDSESETATFVYTVAAQGPEIVPISTALAGTADTSFTVKGVVTLVDGKNIYIQDETGGICLYFNTAPKDIALGDTVKGTGTRATYRGLPELSGATYEKSEGLILTAKETTINEIVSADICTYLTIKNLTVTKIEGSNTTVKDESGAEILIYKAIADPSLAVGDVIDFTGALGIYNTTLQLRNTLVYEITEHGVSPIKDALAGTEGASFTVKGVVTLLDGKNIYVQDSTGGICLYFSTAPADIALGDTVKGTGTRATYRGLPELEGATYEKSFGLTLKAKSTTIGKLTTADVCTYVELKDLEITEVFDNNGAYTSPNIKVKDSEGKTIQIYRAVIDKVDGSWAWSAGDIVDVKAAVGINNTTLQLRNTLATEITVAASQPDYGDLVTKLSQLKNGSTVAIFNQDHGTAISSKPNGDWYLKARTTTIENNKVASFSSDLIWKVEVNEDGTYTFVSYDDPAQSITVWPSGTYAEVTVDYASYAENGDNTWNLTPAKTAHSFYFSSPKVVLKGSNVLSAEASENKLKGTPVTLNEGVLPYNAEKMALLTVAKEGDYYVFTYDGKYLTTGSTGSSLSFETEKNSYSLWSLTKTNGGGWYIKNANAAYNGNPQYIEFYNELFTTYKFSEGSEAFRFDLYESTDGSDSYTKLTEAPSEGSNILICQSYDSVAYIEAYVRNDFEVFSGYFTKPGSDKFTEKDFALQFYFVNPEEATEVADDGEWDGVLNKEKTYVIYNHTGENQNALGLFKEANYSFDAIPTTIDDGKAKAGNGAYVFHVDTMGRYYSFEINGRYLATNNDEELFFVDKDENGKLPDNAKWFLRYKSGKDTSVEGSPVNVAGYLIYNKEAQYGGTPVCIEYFSSVFSGWTFSTKNNLAIYLFNFYEVTDDSLVFDDIVQDPSVVFDCEDSRHLEEDYDLSFSLDDLAEEITDINVYYDVNGRTASVSIEADGKAYSFVIPAAEIDGNEKPTVFTIYVEVTNSYGISYIGEKVVPILDEPFFSELTPAPNEQTKDDKKPVISVKVGNVGQDPELKMYVNDVEVPAVFADGVLSYEPTKELADGRTTVKVTVKRADGIEAEKSWSFIVGLSEYQLYFGQLHSHTTYSDGSGSLETALEYIASIPKSANVQFVAFTDHSNYFDTTSAANPADAMNDKSLMTEASRKLWEEYKGKVAAFNEAQDAIVAIAGYEMTWSSGPGHINSFNTDGLVSRNNADLNNKSNDAGMQLYYATMNKDSEYSTMHQFNHPGTTFGNFNNFSYWNEETDKHIFLVEVGNGEGQIGEGGYYPSYEEYILALDKGWHVAPTNNQDNHKGRWGNANDARDVVLTNDFSEEGIYDAIRAMRVYATEDKNLQLSYQINDQPMGTVFEEKEAPKELNVVVTMYDPDNSDSIVKAELVSDSGAVAYTWDNEDELKEGMLTAKLDPKYSYYFLRVTQADGDLAVTAPIWVGKTLGLRIDSISSAPEKIFVNEDVTLTVNLSNKEDTKATVKSIVYTINGSNVIGSDTTEYELPANGTLAISTAGIRFEENKHTKVTVTVVLKYGEDDITLTLDKGLNVWKKSAEGEIDVTKIATVRADEDQTTFVIEGIVTSNASGYDMDTAFFDCIYVQDETGGICTFPVADEFKIGDKVRVAGYTDSYQGEPELQVETIKLLSENNEVDPIEVTAKQVTNREVEGQLITAKGTVESFELANGLVQTIMVKDADDDIVRVFIDGYITIAEDVEGLAEGVYITATGLASYDNTFNAPDGPFPRIRIRDRKDIICSTQPPIVHVSEIDLSEESLELLMGDEVTLVAEVLPEDADNKAVKWSSSNEEVVTVDSQGNIEALKVGKAVITVTSEDDENVTASCDVRVLFSDVTDPTQFYYDYIYWMADEGITTGWTDGTFRPYNTCNRASIMTFLWRYAGKPEPSSMASFPDMTGNEEFDKAISWGVEKGITTGYSDGTFRPWSTCHRAAIITFLWRYAGSPEPSSMAGFTDMTANEDFNKAISWGVEKGITTGWNDNTFRPWNDCNRLQVASFLGRYQALH